MLVSELLDAIDMTAATAQGSLPSQAITITHPLQPFAPGNFAEGRRAGYAAPWFRAAQRLAQAPGEPLAPFAHRLPPPDEDWLTLEPSQLIHCFKHPARDGRNRVYSVRDRTRLKLTLRGKRLGLSLQEIRQLVDMYESPSDTVQQLTAFLAILQTHRDQLTQQLEDIRVTLEEIEQHEDRARALLAEAGHGDAAP